MDITSSDDIKGSPKSTMGCAAIESNQSRPLQPSRPFTIADCVMKFFISGSPGLITGTFLNLYFDSSNNTLSIELSIATGMNGAHLYDLSIAST